MTCTGIAASWCPVHGDCTCPVNDRNERTLTDPDCPLHAPTSPHAEPVLARPAVDKAYDVMRKCQATNWGRAEALAAAGLLVTEPVPSSGVLDLDARPAPEWPGGTPRFTVLNTRVPRSVDRYVRTRCEAERTTPSMFIRRLIEAEMAGGLPADCREWLAVQAAQCGLRGDVDATLVTVLRHLAKRWPNGGRLNDG